MSRTALIFTEPSAPPIHSGAQPLYICAFVSTSIGIDIGSSSTPRQRISASLPPPFLFFHYLKPLTHAIAVPNMSSKGWFNLETAAGTIPETQFFEGDSAFKSLGLTRTQRLYGFAGWCVLQIDTERPPRFGPGRGSVSWSPLLMTCNSACSVVTLLDWF